MFGLAKKERLQLGPSLLLSVLIGIFCPGVDVYSDDVDLKKHLNRLVNEKSPYLLQHAGNPVSWYPWSEEAFQKAKKENKPIFLSIGYATCHWCHVMAHESFEDEEVARILNEYYISIKVDREERPDVDKIYMSVCQSLTGRGGWPLSIFMTPEGKPFFAGTYFPKLGRLGMTGFIDILKQISAMWQNDNQRILKTSEEITGLINSKAHSGSSDHVMGLDTLKKGYTQLANNFDSLLGGFGSAPKFPTPHNLSFLLRWHHRNSDPLALEMVEKTLDSMRRGGIFDQIGFGFHRYSVDEKWLVPHFEKMLYDQALSAIAYTEAYQVTGKVEFARVAREVFTYVLRDMTAPDGGFYCAEDADSEGEEGLFYLWEYKDIKEYLGEEVGELFCRFYNITKEGNFEQGRNIPHITVPISTFAKKEGMDPTELNKTLRHAREILFDIRKKRVHPLKDDKILTSWNGLMIAAFAKGYQALGDQSYAHAARKAVDFVLKNLRSPEGRILRRYRLKEAAYPGYLDDYAFFVWGLIELYEATFEVTLLEEAVAINNAMFDIFWDQEGGGFFFTGKGNETLITRAKEIYDGALPSGNSVAASNFVRLSRMTGDVSLEKKAEQLTRSFSNEVFRYPMAYTQLLLAVDFMVGPSKEIVIAGDPGHESTKAMVNAVHKKFLPNKVLLLRSNGVEGERLAALSSFVKPMVPIDRKATAYVCERYACKTPTTDASQLKTTLE
ncbi:MAG: thioredoxin domain-containing protein [Thermodesulfobacteriota bacterium]|nr:thioredoxin domain-containing protein [Thermodesulfobacteriota bacterium]